MSKTVHLLPTWEMQTRHVILSNRRIQLNTGMSKWCFVMVLNVQELMPDYPLAK